MVHHEKKELTFPDLLDYICCFIRLMEQALFALSFITYVRICLLFVGVYWYLQLLQNAQHTQLNVAAREQSSINGLDAFAFFESMKKYCNIPTLNNFNGFEGIIVTLFLYFLKCGHFLLF
jgi:hypothetical protein